MKVINNMAIFKTNKELEYLLINLNNGILDIIEDYELEILKKWYKVGDISSFISDEKKLYNNLLQRGYIVENAEKEQKLRDEIIRVLRRRYDRERATIDDIALIFSYNCNFRCPYCFEKNNNSSMDIMSKEMVDAIYQQNKNIKKILFYGGEPLLEENMELINYVISKFGDVRYRIITNGYNIGYYIDTIKNIRLDWIQITLDGKENTHNKYRILKNGNRSYSKIMRNIDILIKHKIPVKIRMNINEKNIYECLELREEIKERYTKEANLLAFEMQPLYQIGGDKRVELENIINDAKEHRDNVLGNNTRRIQSTLETKHPIKPTFNTCTAETKARIFDCKGNVYSCMLSVGNEIYSVGKYYPVEEYEEKSLLNRNISTISACRECKFSIMCGGGCGYNATAKKFEYEYNCYSFFNNLEQYANKLGYKLLEEIEL